MMKINPFLLFFLYVLTSESLYAKVTLPTVFQDGMVLQRDMPVRVWGWANPRERVAVTLRGKSYVTYANSAGDWEVIMEPLPAGGPFQLNVLGENLITINNVMIGDVWVCAGQSNMRMRVRDVQNGEKEIRNSHYPNIRLFTVPTARAFRPSKDMPPAIWQETKTETIGDFSATGYFFGRFLYKKMEVPIGLVNVAWGGTKIQTWIPSEELAEHSKYKTPIALTRDLPGTVKEMEERQGKPLGKNDYPSLIYNGMIAPLTKMTVRGIIWYQGEANANRNESYEYQTLFRKLIQSWRGKWGREVPFLYVQLPNYRNSPLVPENSAWAELREAQLMALDLPNTGMAVAIDIGEAKEIHPKNKQEVGRRLGLAALSVAYEKDVVSSGPIYDSAWVEEGKFRIRFEETGSGLTSKDRYGYLKAFTIAGEDRKFDWAKAEIVSPSEIEVYSDAIKNPVAIRYAWADNPEDANLINQEGLPASPFRTDDWPGITDYVSQRQVFLPKSRIDTSNVANRSLNKIISDSVSMADFEQWTDSTVFDQAKLIELLGKPQSVQKLEREVLRERLKKLIGFGKHYSKTLEISATTPEVTKEEHIVSEEIVIETEKGVQLNALLTYADSAKNSPTVYLLRGSKAQKDTLVKRGFVVFEMQPREGNNQSDSQKDSLDLEYVTFAKSQFVGKPLMGQKVFDILRGLDYLKTRRKLCDQQQISLFSPDSSLYSLVAIFAAAIDITVQTTIVTQPLMTYKALDSRSSNWYNWSLSNYLPALLNYADLPEVASLIAPRKLSISAGKDIANRPISISKLRNLTFEYARQQASKRLKINALTVFEEQAKFLGE